MLVEPQSLFSGSFSIANRPTQVRDKLKFVFSIDQRRADAQQPSALLFPFLNLIDVHISMHHSIDGECRYAAHAQLIHYIFAVCNHRCEPDVEPIGNLLVDIALHEHIVRVEEATEPALFQEH